MRLLLLLTLLLPTWNNGHGDGGARTDTAAECTDPPYFTPDWIAEHALMMAGFERALPEHALLLPTQPR